MILVDTSVWIDHLRVGEARLVRLLDEGRVLVHSFVIGELALGRMRQGAIIIDALNQLPLSPVASHAEVMTFVQAHQLSGQGFGYVDAHLLAAVRLAPGALLWTRDKRLLAAAVRLGLAATVQSH